MRTTGALVVIIVWAVMSFATISSNPTEAQIGLGPTVQIAPTPSGIAIGGAGIGSSTFQGVGIRPMPSGALQVGGFSQGTVIKRYESPKVEFHGPVTVVPPPPPLQGPHPLHGHLHLDEWDQYCWTDSSARDDPRIHCMNVRTK